MRNHFLYSCLFLSAHWLLCLSTFASEPSKALNVLFIAVDDLRPALGCYGDPIAKTPNFDRLAKRGMVFNRAYCQQAVCSPSRASLMTGRRPDTTKVWDLNTHFREAIPDVVTLPQYFKQHGYHAQSIGKIYHGSGKPAKDPPSWSEKPMHDLVRSAKLRYVLPENLKGTGLKRSASEMADVRDDAYIDGVVCKDAIAALKELKSNGKPFFLAVGFRKPHLPFNAPKKYWDMYDRSKIPAPKPVDYPNGAPEWAVQSWNELVGYTDIEDERRVSPEKTRELRHGYYACVSYIDAQLGHLLDELDDLNLTNNTVIVLWGDHGFHLGELNLWTKCNNFELATRAPLIIASPGQLNPGTTTEAIVEFVDIYPTLVDLCGLEMPEGLEGISLRPVLNAPKQPFQRAAFSQFPRGRNKNRPEGHGDIMGYAVRTDYFRYVEWQDWKTKEILARELYDHQTDPLESKNVASDEQYRDEVEKLSDLIKQGWKGDKRD